MFLSLRQLIFFCAKSKSLIAEYTEYKEIENTTCPTKPMQRMERKKTKCMQILLSLTSQVLVTVFEIIYFCQLMQLFLKFNSLILF